MLFTALNEIVFARKTTNLQTTNYKVLWKTSLVTAPSEKYAWTSSQFSSGPPVLSQKGTQSTKSPRSWASSRHNLRSNCCPSMKTSTRRWQRRGHKLGIRKFRVVWWCPVAGCLCHAWRKHGLRRLSYRHWRFHCSWRCLESSFFPQTIYWIPGKARYAVLPSKSSRSTRISNWFSDALPVILYKVSRPSQWFRQEVAKSCLVRFPFASSEIGTVAAHSPLEHRPATPGGVHVAKHVAIPRAIDVRGAFVWQITAVAYVRWVIYVHLIWSDGRLTGLSVVHHFGCWWIGHHFGRWRIVHHFGRWWIGYHFGRWRIGRHFGRWRIVHHFGRWRICHHFGRWRIVHHFGCWRLGHHFGRWRIVHFVHWRIGHPLLLLSCGTAGRHTQHDQQTDRCATPKKGWHPDRAQGVTRLWRLTARRWQSKAQHHWYPRTDWPTMARGSWHRPSLRRYIRDDVPPDRGTVTCTALPRRGPWERTQRVPWTEAGLGV